MSRRLLIATSVAAAVVAAGALSTAGDRFQMATAQELITGVLDPGTVNCIGGEPAPPPALCTPGTAQIHTRGRLETAIYFNLAGEAAALIDGPNTIVSNCNLDASLQGHCWGTVRWQIPAQGGQWEGIWNGKVDLANFVGTISGTVHGSGGALEGLQMKVNGVYPGGTYYGDYVVRILFPGGD